MSNVRFCDFHDFEGSRFQDLQISIFIDSLNICQNVEISDFMVFQDFESSRIQDL